MGNKAGYILAILVSSLLLRPPDILAHGGHEENKVSDPAPLSEPEKSANEYMVPPDADLPDMPEPHGKHSGHGESHKAKMATHEWVSPSQKGYAPAVGITVLAGLVFGVLSFVRPNE